MEKVWKTKEWGAGVDSEKEKGRGGGGFVFWGIVKTSYQGGWLRISSIERDS